MTTRSFLRVNKPSAGLRGFTLIELLAVMAIMAILLATVVPALSGVNESNNINSAGQTFADQVNLARQLASARNMTVEVRCLKLLPVPATQPSGYNGILLWSPSLNVPLSRLIRLPDGVAISPNTTAFSTLFASFPSAGTMPLPAGTTAYQSFTISPSGIVGPLNITASGAEPDMSNMTVGILPSRLAPTAAALSGVNNYMLVQVNPVTAATLIYRP